MEKLLNINELGEILGRSVGALRNDLSRNPERLPVPIRIGQAGRLLRWRPKDIRNWIDGKVEQQSSVPKKRRPGRPSKAEQIRQG